MKLMTTFLLVVIVIYSYLSQFILSRPSLSVEQSFSSFFFIPELPSLTTSYQLAIWKGWRMMIPVLQSPFLVKMIGDVFPKLRRLTVLVLASLQLPLKHLWHQESWSWILLFHRYL